jgi:hypothetical protein
MTPIPWRNESTCPHTFAQLARGSFIGIHHCYKEGARILQPICYF